MLRQAEVLEGEPQLEELRVGQLQLREQPEARAEDDALLRERQRAGRLQLLGQPVGGGELQHP